MTRAVVKDAAAQALLVWAGVHTVLLLLGASLVAAHSWVMPPIVGVVVFLDQRACRETVFLANLGIRERVAPFTAVVTALVLELALYGCLA